MSASGKPSLCIVAHNGYGALNGRSDGYIGGTERQRSLMAHWFSRRDYRVSVVTWPEGSEGDEAVGRIRIVKLCRPGAGLPLVRFIHPRWTSLWSALRRADADVYYHNSVGSTGQIALWCLLNRRRFVYSVSSDPACDGRLPLLNRRADRVLYRFGVEHAACLVAQTARQQAMLREGFGREAMVLPMPCPSFAGGRLTFPRKPPSNGDELSIVWVGRLVELKRLEWFLSIAARLPSRRFEIAAVLNDNEDPAYGSALLAQARARPNVRVHTRLCGESLAQLYHRAACLCCTSRFEGFPNVFLEAWSCGVPVASTVDPDELIRRRNLGVVAADPAALADAIAALLEDPVSWQRASENCRRYYAAHHTVDAAMRRFEAALVSCSAP